MLTFDFARFNRRASSTPTTWAPRQDDAVDAFEADSAITLPMLKVVGSLFGRMTYINFRRLNAATSVTSRSPFRRFCSKSFVPVFFDAVMPIAISLV